MIGDNIKRIRKQKGLSQEELAVELFVVRQTVSKWEGGLSVPDADAVIKIAEVLNVSVNDILGVSVNDSIENLTEELARANELLAQQHRENQVIQLANRVRGAIISLSFIAVIFALSIKNSILSICLIGVCSLFALIILYCNLALLTKVTTNHFKTKSLKVTTIFDIVIMLVCVVIVVLIEVGIINIVDESEKYLALAIISCVMIFSGIISPKLPFSKHTGLRLPWTVQDEDTWNLAHRIIGYTAMPIAIFYIAGALVIDYFEIVTLVAIIAWIGIPAIFSCLFYYRKLRGKV